MYRGKNTKVASRNQRRIQKRKGCHTMSTNVLDIKDIRAIHTKNNTSLMDMIFDPVKRKELYNSIDKHYTSTREEDEIFNEWNKRRKRGGK